MFKHEIKSLLESMQVIDPNGDWKDAPLTDEVMWAMYDTVCRWYDDTNGKDTQVTYIIGSLEDMYDNIYGRILREYPITMLDLSILKAQHKEIYVGKRGNQLFVTLGDIAYPVDPREWFNK